jgi:hypothetical protein
MNSREATLDGVKVVLVLKAIPIPIPKINTPAKIAMEVKLNAGGLKAGDFVAVADLPEDLRLIFA